MFHPCMNHGLSTVSQTIMGADLEGTTGSPRHPSLMSLLPHLKKTANAFTVVWKIVSFGIKFKELENHSYSKTYYWEPAERDKDLQGEEAAISGQDPWGLHQTPWQRKGMRWVYSKTPGAVVTNSLASSHHVIVRPSHLSHNCVWGRSFPLSRFNG